MCAMTTESY